MHPEAITSEAKNLIEQLSAFDKCYLAGGTGLALQIGHRKSVDFDFFTRKSLSGFLPKLESIFPDFTVKPNINQVNQITVEINSVQLSFVKYPFPIYDKFIDWKSLKIIKPETIAAMKAYTLGRRATFKDYVDLYYLIKLQFSPLSNIVELSNTIFQTAFNDRLFLEQLVYLEDVTEEEIVFLGDKVSKKEIEGFFEEQVKRYELH